MKASKLLSSFYQCEKVKIREYDNRELKTIFDGYVMDVPLYISERELCMPVEIHDNELIITVDEL